MPWHQNIQNLILSNNIAPVIEFYEKKIGEEPEQINHHLYLGLSYLLQGNEESSQMTWLVALSQGNDLEIYQWTNQLVQILESEAISQSDKHRYETESIIRHKIREIAPENLLNLLHLIAVEIELKKFFPQQLDEWNITNLLTQIPPNITDAALIQKVAIKAIAFPSKFSLKFLETCSRHIEHTSIFIDEILTASQTAAYQSRHMLYAAALVKFCLELRPSHSASLKRLISYSIELQEYSQAIKAAQTLYDKSPDGSDKLIAQGILLSTLIRSSNWQDIEDMAKSYQTLATKLISDTKFHFSSELLVELHDQASIFFYLQDDIKVNRYVQNQLSADFIKHIRKRKTSAFLHQACRPNTLKKKLKIGYIGHTFRAHSVGWLCRWLFKYHNHDQFDIGIYFVNGNQHNQNLENSFFKDWFRPNIDFSNCFGNDPIKIAETINSDQVDILVDVDSVTSSTTCSVLALKPSPIQVSWLGFDAPGLSTVDYFMADPYVLPMDAQIHYPEKIWRLPQTYIAVDGFEVGIPTLKRENLGIPTDAITYLSSQTGMKRHPDTVRAQMQIIKSVPNSYFLIKGKSDQQSVQDFFTQIAIEVGVNPERLRFLPRDSNEYVHRANLQIADIALDTFPYNGATTTLELLWMGIPIVTQVGEQFSARNSYAFLMNAGITEGIAYNSSEYIDWGIKLGINEPLRQQVSWKLKQSRQSSPLWNTQKFSTDIEHAYQQMWSRYQEEQLESASPKLV